MKKLFTTLVLVAIFTTAFAQSKPAAAKAKTAKANVSKAQAANGFIVKGFHLDLRIQVMTMDALRKFALKLKEAGMNTIIMEWEATYPFEKHPMIPNRYAYTKEEVLSFVKYCNGLGIDVIPLQQSFGHVEYILRNERYKELREDQKDYSQVCPLETAADEALFTDLFTELTTTHTSKYIHIGGDETYLLGHDEKCKLKAEKEGKSKLYTDYIKMLCNIVLKLGKTPVLWADIALKYPEAIKSLPKGTIFVDWNYGWDISHFGDHKKLMESGFEIWGSPSLRSNPDNYNLTDWEKHFNNIKDFLPAADQFGYKGMVMTSWSTSGIYSEVFESGSDVSEVYAIRHVYPLSGFNILVDAFTEAVKSKDPLNITDFITRYGASRFGFSKVQSQEFWKALKTTPYEVKQGEVKSPSPMTVKQLLDSNTVAVKSLYALNPVKNQEEFAHFRLMADIRNYYLRYQVIEKQVNQPEYGEAQKAEVLNSLKTLMAESKELDDRFKTLNKGFLHPSEMEAENQIRNIKVYGLYDRLSRQK